MLFGKTSFEYSRTRDGEYGRHAIGSGGAASSQGWNALERQHVGRIGVAGGSRLPRHNGLGPACWPEGANSLTGPLFCAAPLLESIPGPGHPWLGADGRQKVADLLRLKGASQVGLAHETDDIFAVNHR